MIEVHVWALVASHIVTGLFSAAAGVVVFLAWSAGKWGGDE